MKLNETTLPFLEVDCIQQFGQEKGKLIFEQAEKIYQELLNNADYRNNAAIQNHLQLKLFPTLAYYKALRGEGINQNEALEYVRNENHHFLADHFLCGIMLLDSGYDLLYFAADLNL